MCKRCQTFMINYHIDSQVQHRTAIFWKTNITRSHAISRSPRRISFRLSCPWNILSAGATTPSRGLSRSPSSLSMRGCSWLWGCRQGQDSSQGWQRRADHHHAEGHQGRSQEDTASDRHRIILVVFMGAVIATFLIVHKKHHHQCI